MNRDQGQDSSIVLHRGRAYDVAFGWLVRRTDAEILARAAVASGDRVLDLGTGPGYLALSAARLVAPDGRAVGVDASPEMIARARVNADKAGAAVEYVVAHAESLPFADESFDAAVSRLVIHHLSGEVQRAALREAARVLRPGGRLVIADLTALASRLHHLRALLAPAAEEGEVPAGGRAAGGAGPALARLVAENGFTGVTHGPFARGLLAGVAARKPGGDGGA